MPMPLTPQQLQVGTYPEPPVSVTRVRLAHQEKALLILRSKEGLDIEISHFTAIGWCVEVRYDLARGVTRQSETGLQRELSLSELAVEERDGLFAITAGEEMLEIDGATAQMTIFIGGKIVFQSHPEPFASHPKPVQLHENIVSLQWTDFAKQPWYPGTLFETRMTRFSYPRPKGVVLGLPGHTGQLNRNGYRFELMNWEMMPGLLPSGKPTYQSWPMLMHASLDGTHVTGIFHDNPSRSFVDLGDFDKDTVSFESATGTTRLYIVHALDHAGITEKWLRLLGDAPLPPLWAFGYQQCRWSYRTREELEDVVMRFKENDLPLDAIYMDLDYMIDCRVFTLNEQTFPDLPGMLQGLKDKGVRLVAIVDPGIKTHDGDAAYESLKKMNGYLKNADGTPFIAKAWPGTMLLPDFFSQEVRAWWGGMQREFLKTLPLDGVWNDMNEPINWDGGPQATSKALRTDDRSMGAEWNHYGLRMAQASREGWLVSDPAERPLIISRSGYPGLQRYAVTWHGDNHAWWEHLRMAIDTAIVFGLCGQFYSGPDVPGFSENAPGDLAVRFFQLGSVLPMFRGHSMLFAERKEPYVYPEPYKSHIRESIMLRYRLIDEWYTGFLRSTALRRPPLLPVEGPDGIPERDTFLLCDKFLVCPVTQRDQTHRLVWLPKGRWYRFGDTEEVLEGGRFITEDVRDFRFPFFVREGSIVTLREPARNAPDTMKNQPRYEIYPNAKGHAAGWRCVNAGTLDEKVVSLSADGNNVVEVA